MLLPQACLKQAPTAAHAMLSLSEVPCCESSVMKAWLDCLESARMSAAAATGSIASIFDVSMVGRGRQERPSSREKEGGVPWRYNGSFCAHCAAGGAPITMVPSDFFVPIAFLRTGMHHIIYVPAPRVPHVGTPIGSMTLWRYRFAPMSHVSTTALPQPASAGDTTVPRSE